jgi:SRR1
MDLRDKTTKELVSPHPLQPRGEVEKLFETTRKEWEASGPCKQLRSIFTSTKTPIEISKIVGLACGSMAYSDQERSTSRSAFQHALILTLRDVLGKKEGHPDRILCYAQDPDYNKIDESVLGASRITLLENPKAFLEIDDFSVVISCAPNVPVRQIVSELARPAVMIWDRIYEDEPEFLQ